MNSYLLFFEDIRMSFGVPNWYISPPMSRKEIKPVIFTNNYENQTLLIH